ncbi:MAG: hypothetical protein Q7T74_00090 [Candidatus Saccharibacteria bacterium]|nr:hypothetical protein [Candidatus Saccharibacteria bacterium]
MPNAIDLPACTNLWTQEDVNRFQKYDPYLAKIQVGMFKRFSTYASLLEKEKWTQNMGPTMHAIHIVPATVLRSSFYPNLITTLSAKDVIEVREASSQSKIRKHRFESQLFNFVASFQDFIRDHINPTNKQIVELISVARDIFIRSYMWECSPYVWVCGKNQELTAAPHIPNDGSMQTNKTQAFIQALIADCDGTLDLRNINKLGTVMENDLGCDYYEGSAKMEVNQGLQGKFCMVMGSEPWNNFPFDPYLLDNRSVDLNIVTEQFRGSLWGKWTTKLERYPYRFAADGTSPAPEIIEEAPAAFDYGETKPNPAYTAAPFELAFAMGGGGYRTLEVGPPPEPFSKGSMDLDAFKAMDWNGKVSLTRDVQVPCLDAEGAVTYDTNKYGEFAQLISQVVFGALAVRRRNVVPALFLRQRVGANVS